MQTVALVLFPLAATALSIPSWAQSLYPSPPSLQTRQDPLIAHGCPSASASLTDAIVHLPLSINDVATAQNAIMDWCDKGNKINPSVGSQGHVESSGSVKAQICNLQDSPMPCNSSYVKDLFNAIPCGSSSAPTMGNAAPTLFTMSVAYAPGDSLQDCQSAEDTKHGMGLGDGPLFSNGR